MWRRCWRRACGGGGTDEDEIAGLTDDLAKRAQKNALLGAIYLRFFEILEGEGPMVAKAPLQCTSLLVGLDF